MGQSTQVLTYSPDIWVQVDTDTGQLDLSADIIQGQIQRIENGISQCAFVINNKNAQYSNVLKPMDRITVWLQRITKVQVFSGYLNSAPFIDLYPTTATITASCSLKRLQHTWFNTGLPATMDLLQQTNYTTGGKWADPSSNDYGIGKMLVEVLAQVANWDRSEIHIGNFPAQFLALYQKYVDLGNYETAITALENIMGLSPTSGSTGNPTLVGNSNAAKIFNYMVTQGFSAIQAAAIIGNFMQESSCDPTSVQGGGGPGRGIAQWSVNGRWQGVIALAAQLGGQPTDLSIQCAFVMQELNGAYASTLRALKAATDIVTAVTVFEQGYEAAGTPNMANRISQANNALASFGGQIGSGNQSTASSGSTANSSGANSPTANTPAPGANGVTVTGAQIITAVEAYAGVPYNQANPQSRSSGMDCSGVVQAAMSDLGITIGRDTVQQFADAQSGKIGIVLPSLDPNQAQPGDIIHYNGHEEVWLGGGKVFSESTYGTVAAIRNLGGPGAIIGIVRYAGLTGNGSTGVGNGSNATTFDTALFNYLFQPGQFIDATASLWTGQLSLAGCTQLLPMVQAIAKGGLRSFQSGPNGDFIAYYPDYFGIAGSGTKMTIEDIEIRDLSIVKNDNSFTTHVFTAGDMSGTAGMGFSASDISQWLGTAGVVTVEDADVMRLMLDIDPSTNPEYTSAAIYAKYGARPLKIEFPTIGNTLGNGQGMEWFQAFHIFMQKWSEQYATSVDITFMPELFPGMRIWLGSHNVGVYVSQVTHTIDRTQGFSTQLTISSPSTAPGNPIPGIPVEGGGVPTVS